MAESVAIKMGADVSGATKQLQTLTTQLKKNEISALQFADAMLDVEESLDAVTEALEEMESPSEALGDSFVELQSKINVYKQSAQTAIGVMQQVGSTMLEMHQAYRVQIDAENQLAQSMKNMGIFTEENKQKLLDHAAAQQAVTNYGDELTIGLQKQLVQFGLNTDQIIQATTLIQDVSAGSGESIETVTEQIGKLFQGQAEGLDVYGIQLEQTTLNAEQAMGVLSDLQGRYGGQAEILADPMVQINNAIGDIKEQLGGVIQPLIETFAGLILDAMPEIQRLVDLIGSDLKQGFEEVGGEGGIKGIVKGIADAYEKAKLLRNIVRNNVTLVKHYFKYWKTIMTALNPALAIFIRIYKAVQRINNSNNKFRQIIKEVGAGLVRFWLKPIDMVIDSVRWLTNAVGKLTGKKTNIMEFDLGESIDKLFGIEELPDKAKEAAEGVKDELDEINDVGISIEGDLAGDLEAKQAALDEQAQQEQDAAEERKRKAEEIERRRQAAIEKMREVETQKELDSIKKQFAARREAEAQQYAETKRRSAQRVELLNREYDRIKDSISETQRALNDNVEWYANALKEATTPEEREQLKEEYQAERQEITIKGIEDLVESVNRTTESIESAFTKTDATAEWLRKQMEEIDQELQDSLNSIQNVGSETSNSIATIFESISASMEKLKNEADTIATSTAEDWATNAETLRSQANQLQRDFYNLENPSREERDLYLEQQEIITTKLEDYAKKAKEAANASAAAQEKLDLLNNTLGEGGELILAVAENITTELADVDAEDQVKVLQEFKEANKELFDEYERILSEGSTQEAADQLNLLTTSMMDALYGRADNVQQRINSYTQLLKDMGRIDDAEVAKMKDELADSREAKDQLEILFQEIFNAIQTIINDSYEIEQRQHQALLAQQKARQQLLDVVIPTEEQGYKDRIDTLKGVTKTLESLQADFNRKFIDFKQIWEDRLEEFPELLSQYVDQLKLFHEEQNQTYINWINDLVGNTKTLKGVTTNIKRLSSMYRYATDEQKKAIIEAIESLKQIRFELLLDFVGKTTNALANMSQVLRDGFDVDDIGDIVKSLGDFSSALGELTGNEGLSQVGGLLGAVMGVVNTIISEVTAVQQAAIDLDVAERQYIADSIGSSFDKNIDMIKKLKVESHDDALEMIGAIESQILEQDVVISAIDTESAKKGIRSADEALLGMGYTQDDLDALNLTLSIYDRTRDVNLTELYETKGTEEILKLRETYAMLASDEITTLFAENTQDFFDESDQAIYQTALNTVDEFLNKIIEMKKEQVELDKQSLAGIQADARLREQELQLSEDYTDEEMKQLQLENIALEIAERERQYQADLIRNEYDRLYTDEQRKQMLIEINDLRLQEKELLKDQLEIMDDQNDSLLKRYLQQKQHLLSLKHKGVDVDTQLNAVNALIGDLAISSMQEGGITQVEGLYHLHPDEAVIPLKEYGGNVSSTMNQDNSSKMNNVFNIAVNNDDELVDKIVNGLNKYVKTKHNIKDIDTWINKSKNVA